jgi:PAS domain S-box-containing protein
MMPLTADDGRPIGFLKILRDRTEQHEAQTALRDSEARTRLALAAADLGIWESTPALGTLSWDARTRELLGHGPDEPLDIETSFMARIHPDDRLLVDENQQAALAPGGTGALDQEYRIVKPDGTVGWVHARGRLIEQPGAPPRLIGTVRDIGAQKAAEEHRLLLNNELAHRIKNTLGVVQAIVSQSLRTVDSPADAREAIGDRLANLGRAHDLLTQTSWTAAPVAAIVAGATVAHGADAARVTASGPAIKLGARPALALTMALHELSTNAAKYGALSNETGTVAIDWSVGEGADGAPSLELTWTERGGPSVAAPDRKGFGSRLIEGSLARDLHGTTAIDYAPDGVCWRLLARLDKIQAD